MFSIRDINIAILKKDDKEIRDILSELDKKSESEMFMKAANHFGFKTVEHHGRRLAMRRDIANTMGYMDESGMRKLGVRYDFETVSLGTFGQNVRDLLITELGLSRNDGKTVFVYWDAFLIAGMQGTTEQAKEVQLYLLTMEKAGRIAGTALDITKAKMSKVNEAEKIVSMVARADRIKNAEIRARTFEYIDQVLDGALALPKQTTLITSD